MDEDIKIFGCLPGLIEIPADILLYWTLKANDFKGPISEQEIQNYRVAICSACDRFRPEITETLGFNFPYANNYQHEIFEEVFLSDGKAAFRIAKKKGKKSKELLEYRLLKLETFEKMQRPIVREMFSMAFQLYKQEHIKAGSLNETQTMKQKVFKIIRGFQSKLNQDK